MPPLGNAAPASETNANPQSTPSMSPGWNTVPNTPPPPDEKPVAEKQNNELTDQDIRDLPSEKIRERLYGKPKEEKEAKEDKDAEPEKKPDEKKPDEKEQKADGDGSDEDLDTTDPEKAKARYRELKTELEKRDKIIKDKSDFENKRGNEIGEMRKIIGAFNNMLADPKKAIDFLQTHLPGATAPQGQSNAGESGADLGDFVNDLLDGKPEGFIKALENPKVKEHLMLSLETNLAQKQTKALEAEDTARKAREKKEKNIKIMVPEYDAIENEIYSILAEVDKMPPEFIEEFKKKKYTTVPDDMLYNYSMRAKDRLEIKQLKAEIAQLKSAPADVLDKIDRAAKGGSMSNTSGQAPANNNFKSGDDLSNLTDEKIKEMPTKQIRELLQKFKNRK